MSEIISISHSIMPTWGIIEDIREEIKQKLMSKAKDSIEQIEICVSELCENAIKYGTSVTNQKNIDFSFGVEDDTKVKIVIRNGVLSTKDLDNVKHRIDLTNTMENPGELYINRLQELLNSEKPEESQLGLYRIVYETGFKLSYQYTNDVITIIAEMNL